MLAFAVHSGENNNNIRASLIVPKLLTHRKNFPDTNAMQHVEMQRIDTVVSRTINNFPNDLKPSNLNDPQLEYESSDDDEFPLGMEKALPKKTDSIIGDKRSPSPLPPKYERESKIAKLMLQRHPLTRIQALMITVVNEEVPSKKVLANSMKALQTENTKLKSALENRDKLIKKLKGENEDLRAINEKLQVERDEDKEKLRLKEEEKQEYMEQLGREMYSDDDEGFADEEYNLEEDG